MTQEELFDKVYNCIHGCIDGTYLHCNIKDGVCRCDHCKHFKTELREAYDQVLDASNRLNAAQQKLGRIASYLIGFEVVADICGGEEIEFRSINDDGPDDYDCIRIEQIEQLAKERGTL
jgi:hypothetical protein